MSAIAFWVTSIAAVSTTSWLVALRTDDGFLFDVRMQGEQATLFFAS